ncbi:MAG: type II secretion system protein [Phycisphaerales bacterium]
MSRLRRQPGLVDGRSVRRGRGFTLIETLAAAGVLVLITALVASSVSRLSTARQASRANARAWASADRAAQMVQRSILQAVRHQDLSQARLVIRDGGQGETAQDSVYVLARGLEPVRPVAEPGLQSDGGEFEIGFRIQSGEAGPALWRRVDKAFDEYQDAGGVATEIAQDVVSFSVIAGDAEGLWSAWDSDQTGLPHMVVIEVRTRTPDGRGSAVARRVASLSRVFAQPTPAEVEAAGGGS